MLTKQVLSVVVPVRRAHDGMYVLPRRQRLIEKMTQVGGPLVVELDDDHRTLNPVIEDAVGFGLPNPGEIRAIEMRAHILHLHPRMPIVHVAHVQTHQIQQLAPLRLRKIRGAHACIVDDDVVLPGLGEILLTGLLELQYRFGAPRLVERTSGSRRA